MNAAFFRNDNGGLELRRYATPADAAAVARARELIDLKRRIEAVAVSEVKVSAHPSGGFTHAVRMAGDSTARIFKGWFPSRSAAKSALERHA